MLGCDSVQNAVHNGRMFWAWGDTNFARYPLGIFDMSSATTAIQPLASFEPPLRLKFDYFTDDAGRPRGVAKMAGEGPTWLSGYMSLPDKTGTKRLVAVYMKIKPPMEGYECGLCVWNEKTANFEHLRTVWTKSEATPKHPPMPQGHPVIIDGDDGKKWAVFGDPFPKLRCPATFEAWQDPATLGKCHVARDVAIVARRKTDQGGVGFDRLERVSKTLGDHLYAIVRHAVGVSAKSGTRRRIRRTGRGDRR